MKTRTCVMPRYVYKDIIIRYYNICKETILLLLWLLLWYYSKEWYHSWAVICQVTWSSLLSSCPDIHDRPVFGAIDSISNSLFFILYSLFFYSLFSYSQILILLLLIIIIITMYTMDLTKGFLLVFLQNSQFLWACFVAFHIYLVVVQSVNQCR